jgi:quercetin dioxygenase-like cupin family protein
MTASPLKDWQSCTTPILPLVNIMNTTQRLITVLALTLSGCAATPNHPAEKITSTQLIKTTTTWDGKAISYPTNEKAQVTALMIEIPVNGETGWHHHPVPSYAMILEGTLDVMLKDGSVNHLKAGDPLVEVVDTSHNGRNTGNVPVKIMVFYTGTVNSLLTIKE